jgi:hypothetical protein
MMLIIERDIWAAGEHIYTFFVCVQHTNCDTDVYELCFRYRHLHLDLHRLQHTSQKDGCNKKKASTCRFNAHSHRDNLRHGISAARHLPRLSQPWA